MENKNLRTAVLNTCDRPVIITKGTHLGELSEPDTETLNSTINKNRFQESKTLTKEVAKQVLTAPAKTAQRGPIQKSKCYHGQKGF